MVSSRTPNTKRSAGSCSARFERSGVGAITFDGDGALVPMSMWCGGLCGTWFTYRVAETDEGWVVVGVEGPIAVS